MARRVIIMHGWGMSPSSNWIPWLGDQLKKRGFEVIAPQMPETESPRPEAWVETLEGLAGKPDEETCFVGHSLGAMTIIKYLQKPHDGRLGLAVLVAPWPNLNSEKDSAYSKMASRWMNGEPDWKTIRKNVKKTVAIFSTTDPYVFVSNSERYKSELEAEIIIEQDKGHITQTMLQSAFDSIISYFGVNP